MFFTTKVRLGFILGIKTLNVKELSGVEGAKNKHFYRFQIRT